MKVYRVQIGGSSSSLFVSDLLNASWVWEEAEVDDQIIITVVEMSEEKLKSLPEFEGF